MSAEDIPAEEVGGLWHVTEERVGLLMAIVRDRALMRAAMAVYEYADELEGDAKDIALASGDRVRRLYEKLRKER